MPNSALALLILAVAILVVFLMRQRKTEGFEVITGIPRYDQSAWNRAPYVDISAKRYNPLADQYDVTRSNFAKTNDPIQLDRVTAEIKSAMATAEIQPDTKGSRFGVKPEPIHISMPPANELLMKANQCENIQGRSCDILRDPSNKLCGICIKGGTAYSRPDKPGKHIGGLFILPEDREEAEARASHGGASYVPTVGECEPGYFFVSADKCERAKNRLECAEAGEAGGFDGTMKDIARSKCAQVVNGDGDKYVYEPRGRRFNMNLRVITPTGVGIVKVFVNRASNNELIGSMTLENSGREFIVPVRNVGEAEEVNVKVLEEVPHRPRGRSEIFHYYRNQWGYTETIASSTKLCESLGARIATNAELVEAQRKGAQTCSCGNTATTNGYPTVSNLQQFGIWGCGSPGVNYCGTEPNSWNRGKGGSWCIGVKPPEKNTNMELFSKVFPFFQQITPKEEKANIWSEHGDDYQAPSYRGVIMQWESEDGKRSVPFEPSIVKVNGAGPSNIAQDGTMTFSNLRRLGTFASSAMIIAPRPSGAMIRNQFWIWNNQPTSQTVVFSAKIPGVFKDPFYAEDIAVAPRGPLISTPETMKLMRTSPCLRDGEEPGKYSAECLSSLFRGSGGDILRGTLVTEGGGLTQLLKIGDLDKISEYLANLFSIATKGRDAMGNRVGSTSADRISKINEAAQKMFGFDIATPCEDITEDAAGNMVLVQKTGFLNADCLDYLWMNTGNERERGNEDRTRNTSISNTYTTLWDRYSGLRSNEGSAAKRSQHPFQACQRTGSKAPIGADGKPNISAISEANAKGDMKAIQNWYNDIHINANYMNPSKDNNPRHKEFMKQCYGVNRYDRIPKVSDCDGVYARYVRVLATAVHNGINIHSCIQIPQIQVFDSKDNEVAKGKPTSAKTVGYGTSTKTAVDGVARPRAHWEGGATAEYHDDCTAPDKQFWMVDLGSTMKISRVVFYPRTDCCDYRQLAAPIQLLNEDKQIVAQQWIGQNRVPTNQVQNLVFTSDMGKPVYPITTIKAGLRFSLLSATSFDRYLRHAGFAFWAWGTNGVTGSEMDALYKNDSTMIIRPANNGRSGYVSFESVNFPSHFLRHAGYRCWLHRIGGSQVDKDDSSFEIIPALNGDPSMVSFRSANFPTFYLATRREAPGEVWITQVDTSNVWDVQRVSWKMVPGLA
jgi:hypothetical protein